MRVGKTLITGRVDLTDAQEKLIAVALATYMVLD